MAVTKPGVNEFVALVDKSAITQTFMITSLVLDFAYESTISLGIFYAV